MTGELPSVSTPPSFALALRYWAGLGWINFGGPAGQIAIMHEGLVEKRKWVDEETFLHALSFCMLLPGPEAQQLATYIGWRLHGIRGGVAAGLLFILPSVLLLWGLSWLYAAQGGVPAVAAIFWGLKAAVIALVFAALVRLGKKALRGPFFFACALGAVLGLAAGAPFPLLILLAVLSGALAQRARPGWFPAPPAKAAPGPPTSRGRDLRVALTCLAVWGAPLLAALLIQGRASPLLENGLFFSRAAMVTFGGAYAVLPHVARHAVGAGWLAPAQMIDGLGLAETTPGPLIMVVQFVGFMAGWNHPGALPPLAAATLGAAMATWCTFAPCFLWIFLGAPHIERLRGDRRLSAALAAVTAAVVGVILHLALWFAWHAVRPASGPMELWLIPLALLAFYLLHARKWELHLVVGACALAGLGKWGMGAG